MKQVLDAEIEVNQATGNSFTIDQPDILDFSLSERGQTEKATGGMTIASKEGEYTQDKPLRSGDQLIWKTQLQGESSLSEKWYGWASPSSITEKNSILAHIDVDLTSFVFGVLNSRNVYQQWEDRQISAIIDEALQKYAPELDRSKIANIPQRTDVFRNGSKLMRLCSDLAQKADAWLGADGTSLVLEPIGEKDLSFVVQPDDYSPPEVDLNDSELANLVRVEGGKNYSEDEHSGTQASWTTITNSTRETFQLNTVKSDIDRVQIWTRLTGSEEQIKVRIQKEEGSSPVDIANEEKDIVSKKMEPEQLTDGGITTFTLSNHKLPNTNVYLIVETDGSSGQEVGLTSGGDLAFYTFFRYPIIIRSRDQSSIEKYRRRDFNKVRDNLRTTMSVISAAQKIISKQSAPGKRLTCNAKSLRFHNLGLGEKVEWRRPDIRADGDYILVQKDKDYSANQLKTTLYFQEAKLV